MNKNKKITLIISIALVSIILLIGVTYALTYTQTSTNQELVLGDIYMRYNEVSGLSITDAVPGSDYSNYFEFTISGKNTYTKKDIYYDFILNRGDIPTNKTEENRIPDKYLKFKLVSVDSSNQETEIFIDKTYASLNNQRIHVETIYKNTTNEVNRKYRLYMTIDNSLLIGNTSDAVFTFDEWESAFASVKVNVTGDFDEKDIEDNDTGELLANTFKGVLETRTNSYIKDTDGIIYISGESDDNDPSTTDDIDFNYVWYSGKLWRITAINPDGSLKLITQDNITSLYWGSDSKYSTSWVREWLNQEFLPTLYNYENVVDIDAGWYSRYSDTVSNKPTGDYTLTDPVGLLNAYEYYQSYRKASNYNKGYLASLYDWWLITTYSYGVWYIHFSEASYSSYNPSSYAYGIRPSINLLSTVLYAGGDGSRNNPYILKQDQGEITPNVTLLNTRQSGEYVEIENDKDQTRKFRIVGTEAINGKLTTKLVLEDCVKIKSTGYNLSKRFSNDYTYGDGNSLEYWDYFLNTHWITSLDSTKLEQGTYYLGFYTQNYKSTVCSTVNSSVSVNDCINNNQIVSTTWKGYVGFLRAGEMFSSQLTGSVDSTTYTYLITPYNTSSVRIESGGGVFSSYLSSSNKGRPTINLKSDIVVKSGNGTEYNPYKIVMDTYVIADGEDVYTGGGSG